MPIIRRSLVILLGTILFVAMSRHALAFVQASVGGHEGEIDMNVHFIGEFGLVEPTERPTTFQSADVKILTGGIGYTIGRVGPLHDFYVRIEGAYFNAGEEEVESEEDDLPRGYRFFERDRGGYLTGTVATNFVHEARFAFGAFVQGTVPLEVNFQKFSNVHLHYAGGGTTVGVFLTDPTKVVRLAYASRLFFGSGTYLDGFQHNAVVAITNLFALEAARWALPWRIGVLFGPYFEGDLNQHVNTVYNEAYARVSPDLVAGDRVRSMRFALAVLPYIRITDHAAIELGYVQKFFGYDAPATQFWSAGLRSTF